MSKIPMQIRLGNFICPVSTRGDIHIPITNTHHRVSAIDVFGTIKIIVPKKVEELSFKFGEYAGIPITPEWLLRLGWQYLQGRTDGEITKDAFKARLEIDWDSKGMKIKSRYMDLEQYRYLDHIQYVHQLQNLYYFLEGEELEVKP